MRKIFLFLWLLLPAIVSKANCTVDFTYQVYYESYGDSVVFHAVNYDSLSTGSYSWDFGDGTYDSGELAIHFFGAPGVYEVNMHFYGNSDTCVVSKNVTIEAPCETNFSYNQDDRSFTFYALDSDSSNNYYMWDFGDGNYGQGVLAGHYYQSAGTYNVQLTKMSSSGDTCYAEQTVIIEEDSTVNCQIDFTYEVISQSYLDSVIFEAVNYDSLATGSYFWKFDDNTFLDGESVIYLYDSPGVYNVELYYVTGHDTCMVSKEVTIEPDCETSFTYNKDGNYVTFYTLDSDSSNNYYMWDFGDGTYGHGVLSGHTYQNPGTYNVELAKTDGFSDTCYSVQTIVVEEDTCQIMIVNHNNGATVDFYVANQENNGTFHWDFGDGSLAVDYSPSHTYSQSGYYDVTVKGSTADSCYGSKTIYVEVPQDTCDVDFSYQMGDTTTVHFWVNGYDSTMTYTWYFGDGNTGTGSMPVHAYHSPGEYYVTVIENTPDSCSMMKRIVIEDPQPVDTCDVDFSYYDGDNNTVYFYANSMDSSMSYTWYFGDGATGTGSNPTHTYAQPGNYTVTIVSNTIDSCFLSRNIYLPPVIDSCNLDFDYSISGDTVHFYVVNPDTSSYYTWGFGDGNYEMGESVSYSYDTPGTYNVYLLQQKGLDTCEITKEVVIESQSVNTFVLSGYIDASGERIDIGVASLFRLENLEFSYVGKVSITAADSGRYNFSNLPSGYYLVQFTPSGQSAFFLSHESTFSGNVTDWRNAFIISLNSNEVYNISLTEAINYNFDYLWNTGVDIITGIVSLQGGATERIAANEVVENALVTLYNANGDKLASTFTDANGEYKFENVIAGDYTVVITYPGTTENVTLSVSADGDAETTETLNGTVQKDVITGISNIKTLEFSIAPNPVSDYLNILYTEGETVTVDVIDASGSLLRTKTGSGNIQVNVRDLPSGFYMVRMVNGESVEVKQFVKK